MSDPKTATPPPPLIGVQYRVYEVDLVLLDKIAAMGELKGWPGEWNTRPMAIHSLLPFFVSHLPQDQQDAINEAFLASLRAA